MPEVRFGFETPEGLSGELAYAREPGDGGRLELRFTSPRLRRADGSDKWFELRFNNIGETGPLAFLESLDQGYLNDKLTNLSVRRFDLFGTVENVRRVLEEEDRELDPDQVEAAERAIDLAAEAFAGDHRSACEGLIRALQRTDLPCFRDDPFHLIGSRGTLESRLFERIVCNIAIGNNDDHARNHAAFITDDEMLALTPAYDLCPQARSGASAYDLAMAYGEDGRREARLASLVDTAHLYLLDRPEAEDVVAHLVESIREHWTEVCDLAHLTTVERDAFWGRQFMNPAVLS